ncbi:MAG: glyoxalase/bleomycin resistance/extradiol dioxygenase family protein [Chloroflexi bacterium]|nr:glyoxalase/bleomycin resistance/extradiol dioxygenase family protein [Chloroflexota bacterium]
MVQNPPEGNQRVIPYLSYADAPAAIEYLCGAYGFEAGTQMDMGNGVLAHAELHLQDNVVFLATVFDEMGHASPRSLSAVHGQVMVYVDNVDAHYEHAKAAGAEIVEEIADQFYGDRSYRTVDPEGHQWIFTQHIRDVTPEELMAAVEQMSEGEG